MLDFFGHERGYAEKLRGKYPVGTRIELISMSDPYNPIASGTQGTVSKIDDAGTIHVDWDNGRRLGLVPEEDSFKKI